MYQTDGYANIRKEFNMSKRRDDTIMISFVINGVHFHEVQQISGKLRMKSNCMYNIISGWMPYGLTQCCVYELAYRDGSNTIYIASATLGT